MMDKAEKERRAIYVGCLRLMDDYWDGVRAVREEMGVKPAVAEGAQEVGSFWKNIGSIEPDDIPQLAAVFQLKIPGASKLSYIGPCEDMRSQVVQYQKGESTNHYHLDGFVNRFLRNVEISYTCFYNLADAEIRSAAELKKYREQFNRNPMYNVYF